MKLKLERNDFGTVLSVLESIQTEELAVLKAGLAKLLAAGSTQPLLLDLCSLPSEQLDEPHVRLAIEAVRAWATGQNRELLVASSLEDLGDAHTPVAGLELLASAEAREAALIRYCSGRLARLERQRDSLLRKLEDLESSGAGSLRLLRKENAGLRKRISFAEARIRTLSAEHHDRALFSENAARLRTAEGTLQAVLEGQGMLSHG